MTILNKDGSYNYDRFKGKKSNTRNGGKKPVHWVRQCQEYLIGAGVSDLRDIKSISAKIKSEASNFLEAKSLMKKTGGGAISDEDPTVQGEYLSSASATMADYAVDQIRKKSPHFETLWCIFGSRAKANTNKASSTFGDTTDHDYATQLREPVQQAMPAPEVPRETRGSTASAAANANAGPMEIAPAAAAFFVLGRVAMLRGLVQDFAAQGTIAVVAEGGTEKKGVTFWDFVDSKLQGLHQEGGWTAVTAAQREYYKSDLAVYGELVDSQGMSRHLVLQQHIEGLQDQVPNHVHSDIRPCIAQGWPVAVVRPESQAGRTVDEAGRGDRPLASWVEDRAAMQSYMRASQPAVSVRTFTPSPMRPSGPVHDSHNRALANGSPSSAPLTAEQAAWVNPDINLPPGEGGVRARAFLQRRAACFGCRQYGHVRAACPTHPPRPRIAAIVPTSPDLASLAGPVSQAPAHGQEDADPGVKSSGSVPLLIVNARVQADGPSYQALMDTGAAVNVIHKDLVRELGIPLFDEVARRLAKRYPQMEKTEKDLSEALKSRWHYLRNNWYLPINKSLGSGREFIDGRLVMDDEEWERKIRDEPTLYLTPLPPVGPPMRNFSRGSLQRSPTSGRLTRSLLRRVSSLLSPPRRPPSFCGSTSFLAGILAALSTGVLFQTVSIGVLFTTSIRSLSYECSAFCVNRCQAEGRRDAGFSKRQALLLVSLARYSPGNLLPPLGGAATTSESLAPLPSGSWIMTLIFSLTQLNAHTTLPRPSSPESSHLSFALHQCLRSLNKKAEVTTNRAPAIAAGRFLPLIISSGGITSTETAEELRRWGKEIGKEGLLRLEERIGLELLKTRALQRRAIWKEAAVVEPVL
ncbi:hypothetical protein B9479_003543 [Cryptococcus floricola]|uniref:Uncharacterized protein n=1 Tax=Cryptococcus floricola TaxID=2591691 RepID=A0A5D3B0T5_9TREE|nr:hypothetical protein B9479_003543 [Cryptococcus floricola]